MLGTIVGGSSMRPPAPVHPLEQRVRAVCRPMPRSITRIAGIRSPRGFMDSLLLSSFTAAAAAVRAARATGSPVKLAPVIASHGGTLLAAGRRVAFEKLTLAQRFSYLDMQTDGSRRRGVQRYAVPSQGSTREVGDLCIRTFNRSALTFFQFSPGLRRQPDLRLAARMAGAQGFDARGRGGRSCAAREERDRLH